MQAQPRSRFVSYLRACEAVSRPDQSLDYVLLPVECCQVHASYMWMVCCICRGNASLPSYARWPNEDGDRDNEREFVGCGR